MENNFKQSLEDEIPFTLYFAKAAAISEVYLKPGVMLKNNYYDPKLQMNIIQGESRDTQIQHDSGYNADGTIHWDFFVKTDDN